MGSVIQPVHSRHHHSLKSHCRNVYLNFTQVQSFAYIVFSCTQTASLSFFKRPKKHQISLMDTFFTSTLKLTVDPLHPPYSNIILSPIILSSHCSILQTQLFSQMLSISPLKSRVHVPFGHNALQCLNFSAPIDFLTIVNVELHLVSQSRYSKVNVNTRLPFQFII